MKRPDIVVCTKSGTDYTVQSVHVNFDDTVTFFCSGVPKTVAAEEVLEIRYSLAGATWCPFCDQSIEHFSIG